MRKKLYKFLSLETIDEPYKSIADELGIETALKLAEMFEGTNVYFSKLDRSINKSRDLHIRKEFNGYNIKELALRYGLSERRIRGIIFENQLENQMSVFDITESIN